jgi:hypothetical protein
MLLTGFWSISSGGLVRKHPKCKSTLHLKYYRFVGLFILSLLKVKFLINISD